MQTYRGYITGIGARGVWVEIPTLGAGVSYGPCQSIVNTDLGLQDRVLIAQASDDFEDLVVVGKLASNLGVDDGIPEYTTEEVRDSVVTEPRDGLLVYVQSIKRLTIWDQSTSSWKRVALTSDIVTPPAAEPPIASGTTTQYWRGDKTWQNVSSLPVSNATQTALNGKENTVARGTTSQYYRGDKTWQATSGLPVSTATQTALDDKAKKKAGLVAQIRKPFTISHRGGSDVYPEETMEGLQASANSGYLIEVDVKLNADGDLVCIHDNTTDRTMDISGNPETMTSAQWRAAKVKPIVPGGMSAQPIFFKDVLDRFGGRVVISPELKSNSTAAYNAFINAIKERGLEKDVLAQSFTYTAAQMFAAAGIETVYLVSATLPNTPAAIKASGINYVSHNTSFSATDITALKAAGITCIGYTAKTPAEHDAFLAKGDDGVFSDDPWYTNRQIQTQSTMPINREGRSLWSGTNWSVASGNTPAETLRIVEGGVGIFKVPVSGSISAINNTYRLYCPWAGKINLPFSLKMDIDYGLGADVPVTSVGFVIYNNTSNPDANWEDAATTGQNGFTAIARRSGQLQAWKYVNGAAASSLGTINATTAFAPVNTRGKVTWHVTFTPGLITMAAYTPNGVTSGNITDPDSFNPTDMKLLLRISTTSVVSNFSVSPL